MKVDHCEVNEKPVSCPAGYYDNIPHSYKKGSDHILLPESNPHWRLPIGIYLKSAYVFRILARDVIVDSVSFLTISNLFSNSLRPQPCSLPDSQSGIAFVEYKFEFTR